MVKTLLPTQGAQVQSLARELGSHMPPLISETTTAKIVKNFKEAFPVA